MKAPSTPRLRSRLARWAMAAGLAAIAAPLVAQPTIVLIGGKKQGMPVGEHDFPDGALKLERLIKASPDFAGLKAVVKVFPAGFPKNLAEIDDASVVVLYTGPSQGVNPLQDPAVKQEMTKLMAKGVGLVALHQAFTVRDKNNGVPFTDWLGGIRIGSDRTTEAAPVAVAAKTHPIANGVTAFDYIDEFYPTIDFGGATKVTPILTARIHLQHRGAVAVFEEPAKTRVIAWAHERANGGRAFGFAGTHYLASFDQAQVRTTVLNAILWAAHGDVPQAGATSSVPLVAANGNTAPSTEVRRINLAKGEVMPEAQPWGSLEWYVSRALGNSTKMTVGQATILPGKANPVHWHPNCDEVLHVVSGHIMNRVGDKEFEMRAGDTAVIPEGTLHNARNIGTEDAVLSISYNSADRVAIGE